MIPPGVQCRESLQLCLSFSKQPKESPREEWIREKRELETKVAQLQSALHEKRRVSGAERKM